MSIRYFTKNDLINANSKAIKLNYNRTIKEDFLNSLPSKTRFPVDITLPLDTLLMRVSVIINEKPETVFLDMDLRDFTKLKIFNERGVNA
jgi:hypothetical protein